MGQGIVAVKPIVQHVHDGVPIDGQQLFAHLYAGPLRGAVPVDGGDDGAHTCVLFRQAAYNRIITSHYTVFFRPAQA